MIKMEYEAPEMEILEFETKDCITASGQQQQGDDTLDFGEMSLLGLFD